MIRRLVAYWHRTSEIAVLRDRAVTDAQTIDRLRHEAEVDAHLLAHTRQENARLIAGQDQLYAMARNLSAAFRQAGHNGQDPRCAGCRIVRILNTNSTTTNQERRP